MAALALHECAVPEACAFLWWVMVVGGLFSLQPTVTAPRAQLPGAEGFFRAQSQKDALDQEAGGQGYSLGTGRTWRPLEVMGGQHTEGLGSCQMSSHCASLMKSSSKPAPDHSLHRAPSAPPR